MGEREVVDERGRGVSVQEKVIMVGEKTECGIEKKIMEIELSQRYCLSLIPESWIPPSFILFVLFCFGFFFLSFFQETCM